MNVCRVGTRTFENNTLSRGVAHPENYLSLAHNYYYSICFFCALDPAYLRIHTPRALGEPTVKKYTHLDMTLPILEYIRPEN